LITEIALSNNPVSRIFRGIIRAIPQTISAADALSVIDEYSSCDRLPIIGRGRATLKAYCIFTMITGH
jgi:hypothetical protein